MGWFLSDNGLRHERVNGKLLFFVQCWIDISKVSQNKRCSDFILCLIFLVCSFPYLE